MVCTDLPSDVVTYYIDASGNVYYSSDEALAGFQFDVVGATVSGGAGGTATGGQFNLAGAKGGGGITVGNSDGGGESAGPLGGNIGRGRFSEAQQSSWQGSGC